MKAKVTFVVALLLAAGAELANQLKVAALPTEQAAFRRMTGVTRASSRLSCVQSRSGAVDSPKCIDSVCTVASRLSIQ